MAQDSTSREITDEMISVKARDLRDSLADGVEYSRKREAQDALIDVYWEWAKEFYDG